MALEKKFNVKINSERCKGCGLCVEFCPKKSIEISKKSNSLGYFYAVVKESKENREESCVGCGNCYIVCSDCAIEIKKCDEKAKS